MSNLPKSVDLINQAMASLGITPIKAQALGITNVKMVSHRSLRFDLPDGKFKMGEMPGTPNVNRVKITATDTGTIEVRLIEYVEHEKVDGIAPEDLAKTLKVWIGFDSEAA